MTVNNNRDDTITTVVSVKLEGELEETNETVSSMWSQDVTIEPCSSIKITMKKPIVGEWLDYEGEGPLLTEKSGVFVREGMFWSGSMRYFSAQYDSGT